MAVVEAFHGTSISRATRIVAERRVVHSSNDYDWLGEGFYFFRDEPAHAWTWAREQFREEAAVLAARIDLEGFINVSSPAWEPILRRAYEEYVLRFARTKTELSRQSRGAHRVDCGVMNWLIASLEASGLKVPGVCGVFLDKDPVFPGSYFYAAGHVQIAVRDPEAIIEIKEL